MGYAVPVCLIGCLLAVLALPVTPLLGGVGRTIYPESQDEPDVKVITAPSVRQEFAEATGTEPEEFTVISYTKQVVRGYIYYAKVQTGDDQYMHIRVYDDIPVNHQKPLLQGIQSDKSIDDPIKPFAANINQDD